uniref:EGF-like domain-containing protein n=1 Tax=Scleropages formosus TaxID=113540 RepID=A0A8C9VN11_SCLFO
CAACHPGARCVSEHGLHFCRCLEGFAGNGTHCSDLNECDLASERCPEFSRCVNTEGSFSCRCWDGYRDNETQCLDVDECLNRTTCPEHSTCVNMMGGYRCPCNPGFESSGMLCEDADECLNAERDGLCDNGTCINVLGSFRCLCDSGFKSNGTGCTDVDECTENAVPCRANSSCVNFIGSYECPCDAGFVSNGTECGDEDECGGLQSKLYPFGEEVGDRMVKPDGADTNSPYISPPLGFPFFGKLFDRLYVSVLRASSQVELIHGPGCWLLNHCPCPSFCPSRPVLRQRLHPVPVS